MESSGPGVEGCLLGTAVGDALGLHREGLSADKSNRIYGTDIRYAFFRGKGWISDDTEQTILVLEALRTAGNDPAVFQRDLAKKLRGWFLMLPAGIGMSTIKACFKLCLRFPPHRSGVRSAGNGAAMRSAMIGVWFADEPELRIAFAGASAIITHTDARAIQSAQLVALAAAYSANDREPCDEFWDEARSLAPASEWEGLGSYSLPSPLSGYCVSTVRAALEIWRQHPMDFTSAVETAIRLGGDTDTVAAIVGGIVGARSGVPIHLVDGIGDWPRGAEWLKREAIKSQRTPIIAMWLRNSGFLALVLVHGFRRYLPMGTRSKESS